jgi:hypothetical protein
MDYAEGAFHYSDYSDYSDYCAPDKDPKGESIYVLLYIFFDVIKA